MATATPAAPATLQAASYFKVPQSLIARAHSNPSALPSYRTEFMRDRDRVMYATAFRRLAGKTQIYTVNAVDDHRKNRLTHTLEVAQIARTIAHALDLDEDLAEAIALGHDLGHTPFGHAGEEMLHKIMVMHSPYVPASPFHESVCSDSKRDLFNSSKISRDELDKALGFKHNIQSVRVATTLEDAYQDGDKNLGLDLTNFTLYGMMTHSGMGYKPDVPGLREAPNFHNEFSSRIKLNGSDVDAWSFEAFIVEWADDIAQWHHDLEDALLDGVMPMNRVCWAIKDAMGPILSAGHITDRTAELDDIAQANVVSRHSVAQLSNIVVDTLVTDLVITSGQRFEMLKILLDKNAVDMNTQAGKEEFFTNYKKYSVAPKLDTPKDAFGDVIALSSQDTKKKFKDTIGEWIHHSRNVERMNVKGAYILRKLFEAYAENPQQLPDGPILHLLVDTNRGSTTIYTSIQEARKAGIGAARVELDNRLKNMDDTFFRCKLMRRICDHIASMTDRYAVEEYQKLYD